MSQTLLQLVANTKLLNCEKRTENRDARFETRCDTRLMMVVILLSPLPELFRAPFGQLMFSMTSWLKDASFVESPALNGDDDSWPPGNKSLIS
mmetsp:Transcript_52397/g.83288  ORF Transcript_52397/g.83288 Transcript_52397/m.83288 type:complete len:93 (-) Transcript_52397:1030-1308(-)